MRIQRTIPIDTASEWVEHNLLEIQKYAGRWVAVTRRGIVATSTDFDDVFQKARTQGVNNPLVFKVPKPSAVLKIMSPRLVRTERSR